MGLIITPSTCVKHWFHLLCSLLTVYYSTVRVELSLGKLTLMQTDSSRVDRTAENGRLAAKDTHSLSLLLVIPYLTYVRGLTYTYVTYGYVEKATNMRIGFRIILIFVGRQQPVGNPFPSVRLFCTWKSFANYMEVS